MTLFDIIALCVILILMLISMLRGLVSEIISLLRWIIALIAARLFTAPVAENVLSQLQPRIVAHIVAFVGIFITVFLCMYLLRELLNSTFSALKLGGVNRILGGLFGAFKGIALITIIVIILTPTDLPQTPEWKNSVSAPFFEALGKAAIPYLRFFHPDEINLSP